MDKLPEVVPVFPLPNVVLFPHVDLPLHIFEPRYREMVSDAMAGDRLIGMVLLRADWRRDYDGTPEIFPLGCVGRVEQLELLPDGRSNLVLHGVECFEVLEEIGGRAYRRARVRWRRRAVGETTVPAEASLRAHSRLRASVMSFLERGEKPMPEDLWDRLPSDFERLVNALGFALELAAIEKLSLLECVDALGRAERLMEIIEFRLAERGLRPARVRGEEPWH